MDKLELNINYLRKNNLKQIFSLIWKLLKGAGGYTPTSVTKTILLDKLNWNLVNGMYQYTVTDNAINSGSWVCSVFKNSDADTVNVAQIQSQLTVSNGQFIVEAVTIPTTDLNLSYRVFEGGTSGGGTVTVSSSNVIEISETMIQNINVTLTTEIKNRKDADAVLSQQIANFTSLYTVKGSVPNYASLPTTNLKAGYVYNVINDENSGQSGMNYVYTGTGWDTLGGITALATALTNGLLSSTDFIKLRDLASTYATKVELANASTPPSLAINKTGANGIVSLQIFSYPVALKVTAVTVMSNATNISVQIGSTTYNKDTLVNVTLPANTELSVLDLDIKAGYTSGSAIVTFEKA